VEDRYDPCRSTLRDKSSPASRSRPAAELAVVSTHLRLAGMLAARYRNRELEAEDLQQLAHVGLARAARRWNPCSDRHFVRFAYPIVLGELEKHLGNQSEITGLPRSMRQLRAETRFLALELIEQLGRDPSESELAEAIGVPVTAIRTQRVAAGGCELRWIHPVRDSPESGSGLTQTG
jgi:RNA polymerase sigma-B factor